MDGTESYTALSEGDGDYTTLFTDFRQMIVHMKNRKWNSWDDHHRSIIGFKSDDNEIIGIRISDCKKTTNVPANVQKLFRTLAGRMAIGDLMAII